MGKLRRSEVRDANRVLRRAQHGVGWPDLRRL